MEAMMNYLNVNAKNKSLFSKILFLPMEATSFHMVPNSRDRIVVSTLRCGRSNPGSNPGHGSTKCWQGRELFFFKIMSMN